MIHTCEVPQERAIHSAGNGWFCNNRFRVCWDHLLRGTDALSGRDLSCLRRELHLFFPFVKLQFRRVFFPTKQILLFMLFRFFLLIWQAIHHGPKALGAALNKDKNRGNGVQWDPNRKSWHRIYIALFRFCLFSIKLAILDIRLNQGYSFVSECK